MKSAPAFIQTKIILYLPFALALFNISLASAYNNSQNPSPEKTEKDKGIKDTQLRKTDYQIKTIVIDAGHGGHDPGCSGKNSREKHLALGVALKLAKNVREKHPDVKVILTRDSDVFIPLHKRAAIANSNNADLFISIHCNYMPKLSYVRGSETYVMGLHTAEHNLDVAKRENSSILLEDNYEKNYDYDPNSPEGHIMLSMFQNVFLAQSILFAEKVEAMVHSSANRKSRGVKQAGFVVLKETTMPSVLIEAGFLSNTEEEKFLRSEKGQQAIADAILKAFTTYKHEIESNSSINSPTVATTAPPPLPATANPVLTKTQVPKVQPSAKTYAKPILLNGQFKNESIENTDAKNSPSIDPNTLHQPEFTPDQSARPSFGSPQREPRIITMKGSRVEKDINISPSRNILPVTNSNSNSIHFYVQMAASSKPLNLEQSKWRNLEYPIEVIIENNLYKYQARQLANFEQAKLARLTIQEQGFPDAFVVAYRFGQRISIEEAKEVLGFE